MHKPEHWRLSFMRDFSFSALESAEMELEERKVDQEDQMPPRQLNHNGIDLVLGQHEWLTGLSEDLGLAGLEYTD